MRRLLTVLGVLVAVLGAAVPEAHAIGLLVPSRSDLDPLMIRSHRVDVTVRERMAETRVEQTFRNHTDQRLEATYIFPIPEGATVSGFAMWVNGERQQGELLDSGQARRVYEQIVARMRDPGLVEYMGGNLFRARVFPIEPHADQRIEIRFTQTLDYQNGVVHYRYPLRTDGPAARTLEDMTVRARIVSRTPIRAVYSPTHAISVSRPDEHHATIGFEQGQVTLDQDFDLYYAVQDREVGLSLLTHREQGEDGYFLAMIAPRTDVTEREVSAKEVLFVFDTSGSMAGEKIERARGALDYMLQRLNPRDRFQVVRFSTDVELLFDGARSVAASPQNVARARDFAAHFVAAGGTAIDGALTEALRTRPGAQGLPRMVVFLTDGMPTIGETDPQRIIQHVSGRSGDARLFAFGVGDDVNTTFLDQLAQSNRGVGDYFRDGAEMERRMSAFYDRIAYPVLTDLRLLMPGLRTFDVYPRDLGNLYHGGQLLVAGRYRGDGRSRVTLQGRVSNERRPHSFAFDVTFPRAEPDNDFLPRLWATRKIGYLLDQIRLGGERPELRQEVVQLAQRFGIVTPYTSYLVVPDEAVPPGVMANRRNLQVDGRFGAGGGAAPGAAQPAPPPEATEESPAARDFRGFDQAITTYDFEDEDVGGDLQRPSSGEAGGSARHHPGRPNLRAPAAPPSGGSGAQGRALSRRLREMREAERSDGASPARTRFVQGRPFRQVGGMWVDSRYRRSMRTLRVRYGSEAYFALVRARPGLRSCLALGQRVTVALDGRRAVIVEPDGPAGVSATEVTRFLAE